MGRNAAQLRNRRKKAREDSRVIKKSLLTKDAIVSDLIACKGAFDQAHIPWVITDGIVLGYVRHNDIIEGDTDLDLGVFCAVSNDEWQRLHATLTEAGFGIRNLKQDFVYGRRRVKLNLWIFHRSGDFYEAFPRSTPGIKFVEKAKWYNTIQLVNFLGAVYPMPDNLEDYIVCRYGKDWKEARYTHDKWRLEKFGTSSSRFEPNVWLNSRCGPKGDLWPRIMKVGETP